MISTHVERLGEIVQLLQNAGELPAPADEQQDIYEPFGRSCEVLCALHRAVRPKLSIDKHKRLLATLHARLDASARFWDGARGAAISVGPSDSRSPGVSFVRADFP